MGILRTEDIRVVRAVGAGEVGGTRMVEISQRISMTSRAAARFSTMEDMLGSLGVGGFLFTRDTRREKDSERN